MNTVCSFCAKFASLISWALSCFDRVIFKGHLPINRAEELQSFVDYVLKQRRCDFMKKTVDAWSERLVEHAKDYAARLGRIYRVSSRATSTRMPGPRSSATSTASKQGLIGILCVQETCPTFKLGYAEKRPIFVPRKVPQRVLYYYFLDNLGLMHVRLQTWAPFTCQIYVNGHEYVARKLPAKHPLRAGRQLLHAVGRSQGRPASGQPFRQAALAENPGEIRPPGQSAVAQGTQGTEPLLGHRSGRVRHRPVFSSASTPWRACSCGCWHSPC